MKDGRDVGAEVEMGVTPGSHPQAETTEETEVAINY
jgi:hypothetical protein